MKVKIFWIFGLIIIFILLFYSCNSEEKVFYDKIKANNDCMIACDLACLDNETISIVMEKYKIINMFTKYNQPINDQVIINSIKSHNPIKVSKPLYNEFYTMQVINQHRVDSLLEIDVENFFFYNHNNDKLINPSALVNVTIMEELYLIKSLFQQKILIKQDCESGYFYEIK